jgi:hypothetical protein
MIMKKFSFLILCAALALTASCSKNSGGNSAPPVNGGPQLAALDLPLECQGGQSIDQNLPEWQPYQNAGCSPYGWKQGHFRRGGCPDGTFAACGTGVGMVCVPGDVYTNYQVAWYNYSDGNRRIAFCGYANSANGGACGYNAVPGAGNIGRACLVGAPNSCGPAAICQPIAINRHARFGNRHDDRGNDRREFRHDDHRGDHQSNISRVGICVQ